MSDAACIVCRVESPLPVYNRCALEADASGGLREECQMTCLRELAFEEVRWFDPARWKRADVF